MKKYILSAGMLLFSVAGVASAHVVVKPASVNVAAYQTFTMGVPNEKDTPVTSIRLLIPEGLESVSPNVKPGWTIKVIKSSTDASAKVTEIDWLYGSIPVGQRDEFNFSAKAPAAASMLQWKAYQTYAGGTTVAWDAAPGTDMVTDGAKQTGPYSQTVVVQDAVPLAPKKNTASTAATIFSVIALALSAASYARIRSLQNK